ncbi:MKI67 FHA domain-interacting nucleolar phosphoprotein [Anopheles moucheti]|uniref:MKI67 FHA domain-interacting nucleolar phosphoprotein n=1 Tax=Anopheles moucheti TaxID=186751 RepID=UPI0022F127D8|nr:MKI67 FHA domain-interacting nucleolar phosphoprotein [Anopheles moucheti]
MAKMSVKKSDKTKEPAAMATKKVDAEKKAVKKRKLSTVENPVKKDAGNKKAKTRRWPSKIQGSGLVFIKHLPKGFYEDEMCEFFMQFGDVERVCVARSKKTQQSKGYGYVHFRFHEVAEIAASAVNNYMMFGRVLKANALPKKITKVPRNFGRAFNSKGEQTGAYRQWLQKRVRKANSYLGPQTLLDRVSKRMNRLKRAEKELHEAGIELPETNNSMLKMQEKTIELKGLVKENLAKRAATIESTEMIVGQQAMDDNDDDDDEDDEDEETAFSTLQPSDFKETETSTNETEETQTNKAEAVKKAQEKSKEFVLAKSESAKPITTSNKENKTAAPVKKQPKTAKLAPSKKKQSEETVVPSLKVKGKLTAKNAKSAKLGKKVK